MTNFIELDTPSHGKVMLNINSISVVIEDAGKAIIHTNSFGLDGEPVIVFTKLSLKGLKDLMWVHMPKDK